MALNHVKLELAFTFMADLASVVSLTFLPKFLLWSKITFSTSNSLNSTELLVNELMKNIYKKVYQYSFFYPMYHCFMERFQDLTTKELDHFTKVLISIMLIMNYQSSNLRVERN